MMMMMMMMMLTDHYFIFSLSILLHSMNPKSEKIVMKEMRYE